MIIKVLSAVLAKTFSL